MFQERSLPIANNLVSSPFDSRLLLRVKRDLLTDKNIDEKKIIEQERSVDYLSSLRDIKYPDIKRYNSVHFRHH